MLTMTDEGQFNVKCLVRHTRRPEVGDKFSSRHGQKGVCGTILQQRDFPFSERGRVSRSHHEPARLPAHDRGKMIELSGAKLGFRTGVHYGTAFGGDSVSAISETLVRHGFSYNGKDLLHCGVTGEPLVAYVFMGPVYYQKLKHMVLDKMHARARASRVLTRTADGGSREGRRFAPRRDGARLPHRLRRGDAHPRAADDQQHQFEAQVCTRSAVCWGTTTTARDGICASSAPTEGRCPPSSFRTRVSSSSRSCRA